jgi:Phloem protein 2
VKRLDGWMELELGHIYCDDGTRDTEVAVSLMETDDENEKGGLIVAGIEVRPIENA